VQGAWHYPNSMPPCTPCHKGTFYNGSPRISLLSNSRHLFSVRINLPRGDTILMLLQIYITQHCVHVYKYITVNIYGRDLLIFIRVTSRQIYPNRKSWHGICKSFQITAHPIFCRFNHVLVSGVSFPVQGI
jgi:hypothetical protein